MTDRDMTLHICYGDLRVTLNAEGVSWAPDVAADMRAHVLATFREACDIVGLDALEAEVVEDDDEDAETEAPTDGAD